MSLKGDKLYKYILKFSLRFTEWSYEIICLYKFDCLSQIKRHLMGAMMLITPQSIGGPLMLWGFVNRE